MSEHTKGPWHVGAMNGALFIIDKPPRPSNDYVNPNQDVNVIAKICDPSRTGDAHARLIAAAPDLLEAAIALAPTLDSLCEWDDGCLYVHGYAWPELAEPVRLLKAAIAKAITPTEEQ